MKFNLFHNLPSWYKFLFSLFVIFSFLIISYMLAVFTGIPLFHLTVNDAFNFAMKGISSENVSFLKYVQIFQSVGAFLLSALFLAWLFHGNTSSYLKIDRPVYIDSLLLAAISIILAIPIINFSGYLNSLIRLPGSMSGLEHKIQELENEASELMTSFLHVTTIGGYIINLFVIAILPALCEEFLFRGIFQRIFIEWTKNIHIGIIITSVMFSFFHLQFYGFIPRFLLGVYLGYLLIWSNTLWLPIAAHFVNNAFAITFYFFANQTPGLSWIDEVGSADRNPGWLIPSLAMFAITVIFIYNLEKRRQVDVPFR